MISANANLITTMERYTEDIKVLLEHKMSTPTEVVLKSK